jgi:hypothetical protein
MDVAGRGEGKELPRRALQLFLDELALCGYAAAKAPELWRNLERGGDWDLVVLDVADAYQLLVSLLGRPQSVDRRSYVWCCYYEWGEIDLLPGLEWRGLPLVEGVDILAGRRRTAEGIYEARPAHQAVAAVIQPLLAAGTYKVRYESLWRTAAQEDRNELQRCLTQIFGSHTASDLASAFLPHRSRARALRWAALRHAMRAPLHLAVGVARFGIAEIRLRAPQRISGVGRGLLAVRGIVAPRHRDNL